LQTRAQAKLPGIIVIHSNRGLNDHFQDVSRRFAKLGYVAIAPDLASRAGGTEFITKTGTPSRAGPVPDALGKLGDGAFAEDMLTTLQYLKSLPYIQTERVGCVGFCFGGTVLYKFLTLTKDIKAAVPYYGSAPPLEDVGKITASTYAMYGELDERINVGIPALESAMKNSGKDFKYKIFPGAKHAFFANNNDNYHEEAAEESWKIVIQFFERQLKT
jgi:carboxymethylenebutenolidase